MDKNAMHKNIPPTKAPNPQGKGLVGVLQAIDDRKRNIMQISSASVPAILRDYALSRLILCADFHFKPVVNTPYHLYLKDQALKLSLIAPDEWSPDRYGVYIGQCWLDDSLFWRMHGATLAPEALEQLSQVVGSLRYSLLSDFDQEKALRDTLPYYDERLPFHRRVLANALASQIQDALPEEINKSLKDLTREHAASPLGISMLLST